MTTLRWALYLGISWTWCIGMFLPVLLIRDFGRWAFLSFAIPNILGAAAMGLVLPDALASRRLVERHRPMMVGFSRVTIAYQAFFAAWMLPQLIGPWALGVYALVIVFALAAVAGDRDFTGSALLTLAVSIGVGWWLYRGGVLMVPLSHGVRGAAQVAPTCLLGFLLCPYLDLTFHRAFQRACEQSGIAAARGAFLIGFGVIFAAMIALTLLYAGVLMRPAGYEWAPRLIGVHMGVQLALTMVLHQTESSRVLGRTGAFWPPLLAGGMLGLACYLVRGHTVAGWQPGEYAYRCFLAMYGLIFPAYVLFKFLPRMEIPDWMFYLACLAALPTYAAGFLTANPVWLPFGTGIVALGFLTSLWQSAYVRTGRIT